MSTVGSPPNQDSSDIKNEGDGARDEVRPLNKQTPILEWCVVENDTEWMLLAGHEVRDKGISATAAKGRRTKWFLFGVATFLFLAVSEGSERPSSPPELQQDNGAVRTAGERKVEEVVRGNLQASLSWLHHSAQLEYQESAATAGSPTDARGQIPFEPEYGAVRAATQSDMRLREKDAHVDRVLHPIEFLGEQAVARVIIPGEHGAPAYRQTRFYQRMGPDWRQVAPNAALWGPERSLETPSFIFRFRQNDATVVIAVASQVEVLYTRLRNNFGLPITLDAEKQVIEISVMQAPGETTPWFGAPKRIIVPSPAVYRAPVELTDAEILAQSLALPLLAQVSVQASEQHQIRSAWQPLLNGLRLWQVWSLDLPLAAWRTEVVQWLYLDLPVADTEQPLLLPNRYAEICAAHKLWMSSPLQIHIPLVCAERKWEYFYFPLWNGRNPPTHLGQLTVPAPPDEYVGGPNYVHQTHRPSQTVALATLVEYAVAVYGYERLPALLAGLGKYESWETLLPAVYGVSPAEFEAGWQTYLAAHYGVQDFH